MTGAINEDQELDFEFGLYTFGDLARDPVTGRAIDAHERLQEIVAAAQLADEAGLDVFGVGEHHRLDFAVSSPAVVMAAIAQVTRRIRLFSATTVLSTADPVQVFEDFATLDLLSSGRAEIIAGRGAFVESFPLFGYDLNDYEGLFSEKIGLLLKLGAEERVNWNGHHRSALSNAEIAPRPLQQRMPVWIGVGGTPESAARAGTLGTGMTIAMLGGDPARFKPLVDIYKKAGAEAGHSPAELKIAVASHGYLASTTEQAAAEFYPYYMNYFGKLMRERGREFQLSRNDLLQMAGPNHALAVGSPQQIIEKILYQHELFGHHRFTAQIDIGGQPLSKVAAAIDLLAAEVAPVVRREIRKGRSHG
ncbi:luciferase [Cohnella kolymensis]|uniref:Luciferase n=1 Tax=Cohnella kolymensis TaxID=1590652 RepID=A0ABR5AA91_9BACL|nr:LLM class flavin-dependent oxidoreductase [Cohnella kolymensis]KIL37593.1 luciferase [Cohnella kolymensis]